MDNIRMNMAIAVPQLFYDLIARVFPGFLFLFLMWIVLNLFPYGDRFQFPSILLNSLNNFWGSLYLGIACFILSYYAGWILSSISNMKHFYRYSADNMIDIRSEKILKEKGHSVKWNYHKIRLLNENVGFRIVKLRAEAKMLEASRTAMCFMAGIMLIVLILIAFDNLNLYYSNFNLYALLLGEYFLYLILPVVIALIFHNSISSAVDRYIGNIEVHYDLMFNNEQINSKRDGNILYFLLITMR